MNFDPVAALLFSLVAALAVGWAGRRGALGGDRLAGASLLLLLAFPLLALLPGWTWLTPGEPASATAAWWRWILPLGIAVGLLRLLVQALRLRRRIHKASLLHRLTPQPGLDIDLLLHPEVSGPCAAGVRRKVILLPPHWTSLPAARREIILSHEIAHHRRRDPLWRWIAALACALHWCNPLVWWLARRHALHAEWACDAEVVASGVAADRYAHLLCDLAKSRPSPLAAAMAGPTLHQRVLRLTRPSISLSRPSLLVGLTLLITSGFVCGLRRLEASHSGAPTSAPDAAEIRLRLSADPFPASS